MQHNVTIYRGDFALYHSTESILHIRVLLVCTVLVLSIDTLRGLILIHAHASSANIFGYVVAK